VSWEHAVVVTRVLVIPGAVVRSYVQPAVDALCDRSIEAHLLAAPGEPGSQADLCRYGMGLARQISGAGPVELLIGLSVGAQVAAVAASTAPAMVRQLMLISPTVDPQVRTAPRLLGRWLVGGRLERPELFVEQSPDWWRAGLRSVAQIVRSALMVRIEDLLGNLNARLIVVHAQHDGITSHCYAAQLAADHGGELLIVPNATHSWPYADVDRFANTVQRLLP
jgi:pimeloyl-ACP methyl ester carboxylesterase